MALGNLSGQLRSNVTGTLQEIVNELAVSAQDNAPEDTGRLKANIYISVDGSVSKQSENSTNISDMRNINSHESAKIKLNSDVEIVGDVNYSGFIESGTEKMQAQPFMQPAVDSLDAIVDRVAARNINKI